MLEGLVLEVELDIVVFGAVTECDVEVNLNRSLGNRSQLVRLAELHIVPAERQKSNQMLGEVGPSLMDNLLEDVAVFLSKENLVDVDFRPLVHDFLDDCLSCFFSHFETIIN